MDGRPVWIFWNTKDLLFHVYNNYEDLLPVHAASPPSPWSFMNIGRFETLLATSHPPSALYSALVFSSYVFFLIFKYSRVSWTILDFFLAAICWIFPYFTSRIAQIHSNSSSGCADQVLGMDGLGPAGVRAVVVSCRALCSLGQTCFSSSCIAKPLTLSGDKSYSDIQTNAVSANAPTHIQTYK